MISRERAMEAGERQRARSIAAWLVVCAALVAAMVVVGGVTRLTHSGLSMVEWRPLVGTIPPLSRADWQALFARYQETPEYRLVNIEMTLEGFQHIFWWEYLHRLLGRVIGVVFVVPLGWFASRGFVDRGLWVRLSAIFVLGALQGALGWYMVASGLVDEPRVSPYRLAAHLGLAFAILGCMLWVAASLVAPVPRRPRPHALARWAKALVALILAMVVSGAFVAGTHAGFQYNTWPLMAGGLAPRGLWALTPWWRNLFENVPLVQLDHRVLAYLVAASVVALFVRCRRATDLPPRARAAARALLVALSLQIALGIATLLLVVPIWLAATHQAGAVALFATAVWLARQLDLPADAASRETGAHVAASMTG